MLVKIKKYVATVAEYIEDENGGISKKISEVEIKGKRISSATVWKQIPREAKLVSSGYIDETYDIDSDKLLAFCRENGQKVE